MPQKRRPFKNARVGALVVTSVAPAWEFYLLNGFDYGRFISPKAKYRFEASSLIIPLEEQFKLPVHAPSPLWRFAL